MINRPRVVRRIGRTGACESGLLPSRMFHERRHLQLGGSIVPDKLNPQQPRLRARVRGGRSAGWRPWRLPPL